MMNEALKGHLAGGTDRPVTERILRPVIREELPIARPTTHSTGKHAKSARPR
jgi:hypothetical protein